MARTATGRNVLDTTIVALELAGIVNGPTDALDELVGEMIRPEIGDRDPLSVDDGARTRFRGIGHYEYLRHVPFPLLGGIASRHSSVFL
jgi:hypothetical protein